MIHTPRARLSCGSDAAPEGRAAGQEPRSAWIVMIVRWLIWASRNSRPRRATAPAPRPDR